MGVEKCTRVGQCKIVYPGMRIERGSDVIEENPREGVLIEMPPTDPSTPLRGDAAPHTTPADGTQHDPGYTGSSDRIPVTGATPPAYPLDPEEMAKTELKRLDLVEELICIREIVSLSEVRAFLCAHGSPTGKVAHLPLDRIDAALDAARAWPRQRAPDPSSSNPAPQTEVASAVVTSPDGNPKTAIGITKPSLHAIPPVALLHLGQAMADGNRKYGLVNWRYDPITFSTYYNATMRHLLALWDGENHDPATQIKHLAYVMANCAILLDAEAQGTLTDDRPGLPGMTAEMIRFMTRKPE